MGYSKTQGAWRTVAVSAALVTLGCWMASCASGAKKLNQLSIGMDKARVIELLGEPDTKKASSQKEVLVYWFRGPVSMDDEYWVVLENGKTTRFGRSEDFGSGLVPFFSKKVVIENE